MKSISKVLLKSKKKTTQKQNKNKKRGGVKKAYGQFSVLF